MSASKTFPPGQYVKVLIVSFVFFQVPPPFLQNVVRILFSKDVRGLPLGIFHLHFISSTLLVVVFSSRLSLHEEIILMCLSVWSQLLV